MSVQFYAGHLSFRRYEKETLSKFTHENEIGSKKAHSCSAESVSAPHRCSFVIFIFEI